MKNWHLSKVWRPLLGSAAGFCVCFGAVEKSWALETPVAAISEKSAAEQAVWLDAFFARTNPFLVVPVISNPTAPSSASAPGSTLVAPSLPAGAVPTAVNPLTTATVTPASSGSAVQYAYQSFSSAALIGSSSGGSTLMPALPPGGGGAAVTTPPSKRPKPPKPPKPPKASR